MQRPPFALAALAILCAANFGLITRARADTVVVIGYAGALTGAQAHFGKDSERGIRLAIDEINATHPVIGGQPVSYRLDAQDDAADPKTATTVAQRFADQHVSAVIGHQNSGTSIAVAQIYAKAGIAELTPSATSPQFTRLGLRTTFRMLANDDFLGAAVARYASEKLHAGRIAVMDDRTAYGQGIADVFAHDVGADGAQVVAREYTTDQAFDFAAALTLIKGRSPDAIFYGGMDTQGGPMLKQMRKYGIAVPLLGGDGLCTQEITRLAGDALNGNLYCADGGRSLAKMPGGPAFQKKFQARYGEPVQLYAPYAYDAMQAIYHAMLDQQSTAPERVVEGLHKVAFDGVTGRVQFDEHGDLLHPAATISTFKGGQKQALTEVSQ
ncbi:amino acid/amide ABC transporter substrate-binding protein (HAAT family) [Paraburkholderia unamae]|uniref:branched-chain amino acid ABC transporter substrate-binding protein n=1 Tax=Paraburkholderia unamae TaxID=219649 RepID=UPI000DC523DF|nr:branched-chain amino acid ABC transporter substrate-binding protein [Paraburkholderia unamae]RAR62441.1 amino acid/amide ABC transporter substrate-binding protein (HAAT family) [Paraburkholderia unamae]